MLIIYKLFLNFFFNNVLIFYAINLCRCGFILGRSRNKVMVGEPVVGDKVFLWVWYNGNISALGAEVVSSSLTAPKNFIFYIYVYK